MTRSASPTRSPMPAAERARGAPAERETHSLAAHNASRQENGRGAPCLSCSCAGHRGKPSSTRPSRWKKWPSFSMKNCRRADLAVSAMALSLTSSDKGRQLGRDQRRLQIHSREIVEQRVEQQRAMARGPRLVVASSATRFSSASARSSAICASASGNSSGRHRSAQFRVIATTRGRATFGGVPS